MLPSMTTTQPQILLCPPTYFDVTYAINPWMTQGSKVDTKLAYTQWESMKTAIETAGAEVILAPAVEGLPDMVFTANAAVVHGKKGVLASYRFAERQPEEAHMEAFFKGLGYDILKLPRDISFEGSGDALAWNGIIFSGYKTRTHIAAHGYITAHLGLPVLSVEMVDPRFYHVDVCMCPTDVGDLIYYPGAFDEYGLRVIKANVPEDKLIEVSAPEAEAFACNAVSVGKYIILNEGAPQLTKTLESRGYTVLAVDMSEFLKSGGSAKCCTLRLN
jgi:N-dimethylarginine dimethylaminohydrolase